MSILSFYFLAFASALLQSKAMSIHSHNNLSTFFFEDYQSKISIICNSQTFFFINLAIPEYIVYSITQNKQSNERIIIKMNRKIQNETKFMLINDTNNFIAYFNIHNRILNKSYNRIHTNKVSSISFISFDLRDLCFNGIEFIQSEKEFELKKNKRKCFYLPPHSENSAVLFTDEKVYKSNIINPQQIYKSEKGHSSFLLSRQDSQIRENDKLLNITGNNYPCKYGKKYMTMKRSIFSIIHSYNILFGIIFVAIFLICVCVSKTAVESDTNDNHTTMPSQPTYPNNYCNNNNQLNNNYNYPPPPVSGPLIPMNQITPQNTMYQNNMYPMDVNPYAGLDNDGGVGCSYHNNVQANAILPPANPSFNGAPSSYGGVVPYNGALPMPNAMQNSLNTMNQVANFYQGV